jgi:hypothetical protein
METCKQYIVKVFDNRTEYWDMEGRIHCDDGPAVIYNNGSQHWWLYGKRHKNNGPAVVWADGTKEWWLNGVPHREDGPAVEREDGHQEWWFEGSPYTKESFDKLITIRKALIGMAEKTSSVVCRETIFVGQEKTYWNYRVIRKSYTGPANYKGEWLGIYEVYYKGKNIVAVIENPIELLGERFEDIVSDLSYIKEALKKPILNWDEIKFSPWDTNEDLDEE